MLPTFVIGLREGVEASLIVGIIAAFLRSQGRRDALRWVWAGVSLAVAICLAVAIGLQILDRQLPQQKQEALETIVAAVAVAMVTWMIVWMRKHAPGLAAELRADAAHALAEGSVWALVAMAFVAVVREGLETSVFLLAAFQASGDSTSAGLGALLGILVASGIGFGLYRGAIRFNLSRFFRITGVALVLVAAGLVMSALHTAHEAGWLNSLQSQAADLSWLVRPGTIGSSLFTGVLGLQPEPTVIEAAGWLLYAVPMLFYVLRPSRSRPRVAVAAVAAVVLAVAAVVAGCGGGRSAAKSTGGSGAAQTLAVKLTDAGCSPSKLRAKSGPVTFAVSNGGTSKVSELELKNTDGIILGERENIVSGIEGSFTLDLQPGRYVLNCPNGDAEDNGDLVVTGAKRVESAVPAALLLDATTGYRAYVRGEVAELVAGTRRLAAAIEQGDLARAKALFGPVRSHYEAVEPVAESFGDLDPAIDARAGDVPPKSWTGFHRIEQILWVRNTTSGASAYATRLLRDVSTLDSRVRTLTFQPAQLANGAVELLNEVASSKITGEEDRYSHTDLSDFAANVDGARRAFVLLRPALVQRGDKQLAATISDRFAAVESGLAAYRRTTPLGFALYGELTPADRRQLAQQVDALAEPLSNVAAKVAG